VEFFGDGAAYYWQFPTSFCGRITQPLNRWSLSTASVSCRIPGHGRFLSSDFAIN
jgi:hypothetical protein